MNTLPINTTIRFKSLSDRNNENVFIVVDNNIDKNRRIKGNWITNTTESLVQRGYYCIKNIHTKMLYVVFHHDLNPKNHEIKIATICKYRKKI
jgi:hypothetical protein